jgi:Uncharacterized conserved protein (COG2071)
MFPVLKGVIARRVLLNFRVHPRIVQKLLPTPFQAEEREGSAIVGVCLIRLERLRPKQCPPWVGMSSENMAHRVAVCYRTPRGRQRAVFIWRRETNQKLVELFGGRLFPGVHHFARFHVEEENRSLSMNVNSFDGKTDVSFEATVDCDWQPTPAFRSLNDAAGFFQGGDCGFSSSLKAESVEGMKLKTVPWSLTPLSVRLIDCAFYFNHEYFPKGSVEFDSGFMMRSVPHEWHPIKKCPQRLVS